MLFNVAIKDLYVKFQEVIGEFFGRVRKSRVAPILDDKNETFDNASDFQFFGQSFQVDETVDDARGRKLPDAFPHIVKENRLALRKQNRVY